MRFPFEGHDRADLVVDAIYEGGPFKDVRADPIAPLLRGVGNQGGFRAHGSPRNGPVPFAVLFTTGAHPDWPDGLDVQTGQLTYWGDNREPGRELHDTVRGGNLLLRNAFSWASGGPSERQQVPPFFVFERVGSWDAQFRGLAVPGYATGRSEEALTAVWRSRGGDRFQNYRATFTMLDVPTVTRTWIEQLRGNGTSACGPSAWERWVKTGRAPALRAKTTTLIRRREDQLPADAAGARLLDSIIRYFPDGQKHRFEWAALDIWRMLAPATGEASVTRASRDGGADAWGTYALGPKSDPVGVEFALEAKCWKVDAGIGVKPMSRLISRLRHRQFGVFVTTSYFNAQVYKEVRTDGHPIVLVSGSDIIDALRSSGISTPDEVVTWLDGVT